MWGIEPYTLDLSDVIRLSDEDLLKICAANPDLRIERNAAGQLEIMSPSGAESSAYEVEFVSALHAWSKLHGDGIVFGARGGFRLPNGAVRAADAVWIRLIRWNALTKEEQRKYAPVTPEFVVEVRSPSDRLPALRRKMEEWIRNGCRRARSTSFAPPTSSFLGSQPGGDGSIIEHAGSDAPSFVRAARRRPGRSA